MDINYVESTVRFVLGPSPVAELALVVEEGRPATAPALDKRLHSLSGARVLGA